MTFNLLPWRERARQKKQRQYIWISGIIGLFFILSGFFYHQTMVKRILQQRTRNDSQEKLINEMNNTISAALQKKQNAIAEKKMQASHHVFLQALGALVTTLPTHVNLHDIHYLAPNFTLAGTARAIPQIKQYQFALKALPFFQSIDMNEMHLSDNQSYQFTLSAEVLTDAAHT